MIVQGCFIPVCEAGEWKTREEIRKSLKKSNKWVWHKLLDFRKNSGVCKELPHENYGRPTAYFAPCVLSALRIEAYAPIPPADGWLTQHQIAKKLGISWRITQDILSPFNNVARLRLDCLHRVRQHYPPDTINSL